MGETPTYASLTPLAPENVGLVNGLADISGLQHGMINAGDPSLGILTGTSSSPMGMSNSDSVNSPSSLAMLSPAAPVTPSSITPEMKNDTGETSTLERSNLVAILQFLKKNNLKGTEDLLRRECGFYDEIDELRSGLIREGEQNINNFSTFRSDGDPSEYEDAYLNLISFVERSMDVYKHEVAQVLYPVFVHMYLELVYNSHENLAIAFFEKFSPVQEDYYQDDLLSLSLVTTPDNMTGYHIMDTFRTTQFGIRISRDSYNYLKRFLSEKVGGGPVPRIIQYRISFDVFDGIPRNKSQVKAVSGALEGEVSRQVNRTKMLYGLLKEPELLGIGVDEDDLDDDGERPRKKKPRKDFLSKSKKSDPNAPQCSRIPLPELREVDKVERAKALRDSYKRATLSKDSLPSICFYTFLNSNGSVSAIEVSDDTSLLAYGLADSTIKVTSMTPTKLKNMKPVDHLNEIDKEADDVLVRMMDEKTAEQTRSLYGHSGPVYGCSFSPEKTLLLTSGKDGTIRLWSLQTWTCLVVYKGHIMPVWDIKFSPLGYYFVSGGKDRTARLWATDQYLALRVFVGHYSDVDVVQYHPNCNYVASGSSDRSVRVWDVLTGNCVRVLTGHKGIITDLCFSPCGRYLASASADHRVLVWDMANGNQAAEMASHTDTATSLSFSRDATLLASGSLDGTIKLWDFAKLTEEGQDEDANPLNPNLTQTDKSLLLVTFPTKSTPVVHVHFTRRNVLVGLGPFEH